MNRDFRVGSLVILSAVLLFFMLQRVSLDRGIRGPVRIYLTHLSDSIGLIPGSKVKIAGINVGEISELHLEGDHARVQMKIRSDVTVHANSSVRVRTIGYLGDNYLDLNPGNETAPLLSEHRVVEAREGGESLDQLLEQSNRLMAELTELSKIIRKGLSGDRLEKILSNVEDFSEDLKVITEQIREGKGTVGKLVNDPETADRLNSTLSGVDRFVSDVESVRASVVAQGAVLTAFPASRNEFWMDIVSGGVNHFLLGVTYRSTGNDSVGIDAQFGRRFGAFRGRVGLFEGTAGLGLDYNPARPLTLTSEIYRFQKDTDPQVNLAATIRPFPYFFLWTGADYISSPTDRSFFLGAGIQVNVLDFGGLGGQKPRNFNP